MKVLVCGGRDFDDWEMLDRAMCELDNAVCITFIIHGAAKGADLMAAMWAAEHKLPVRAYPANWDLHGRRAGPIRNEQMLKEGKPDLVMAFPGGRGTEHMVKIATDAGVRVVRPT